jgi:hypothetical protein
VDVPWVFTHKKSSVFRYTLQETKHSTLNEIVEQDSDSDQSGEDRLNVDEGTSLGLSGALAQMANFTFLAGAPGK